MVGICGGYQMLGEVVHDPQHVESKLDSAPGLGLLPIETTFAGDKATHQASAKIKDGSGWLAALEGQTVTGYEIHMGRTQGQSPFLEITERNGQSITPRMAQSAEMEKFGAAIFTVCLLTKICAGPGCRIWAGKGSRPG